MTLGETLRTILPELILLVGAGVIFAVDVLAGRRRSSTTAPGLALLTLVLGLLAVVTQDGSSQTLAHTVVVDRFALFFKVVVYLGAMLTVIISYGYMERRTRHAGEFYALVVVAALAMSVAVSGSNIILIYLGLEFLSITSYILAGYLRDNVRSNEAGIKYFLYGATSSAIMLYGFSLLYGATGATDLVGIGQALAAAGGAMRGVTFAALVLMLAGLGFKTSLVPFHQWTPDAYEGAPTPVAAYLSTASKAAGFAVLVRITTTALQPVQSDWVVVLMAISMISMTVGNLIALRQTNIKRLLAYSTIAQAGYILIGLVAIASGEGNPLVGGLNGLMLYLFAYLFTNIGAWVSVIAVEQKTGSTDIASFAGMIRRSPVIAVALAIFFLSLAGIPPTAVFYGKFFVFGAAIQTRLLALAAVGAINSVVSAWYYLNVVRTMFAKESPDESPIVLSPAVRFGLIATLVMTLLVGLYPQPFIDWATRSVSLLAMR